MQPTSLRGTALVGCNNICSGVAGISVVTLQLCRSLRPYSGLDGAISAKFHELSVETLQTISESSSPHLLHSSPVTHKEVCMMSAD